MALKAYSPQHYNNLGDVRENSKLVTLTNIFGLGKIIKNYGYADNICVIISHRHFDLDDNEVMYEICESEERISEARQLSDICEKSVQPNFLSCGIDGSWYPVGYESSEVPCLSWHDKEFLKEAAKYLLDNNLTDKLGLVTRHSLEAKRNGIYFMEENFFKTRRSVTRPSSPDEIVQHDAIPTTYSFDNDAQTAEEGCFICNNCSNWNHKG